MYSITESSVLQEAFDFIFRGVTSKPPEGGRLLMRGDLGEDVKAALAEALKSTLSLTEAPAPQSEWTFPGRESLEFANPLQKERPVIKDDFLRVLAERGIMARPQGHIVDFPMVKFTGRAHAAPPEKTSPGVTSR